MNLTGKRIFERKCFHLTFSQFDLHLSNFFIYFCMHRTDLQFEKVEGSFGFPPNSASLNKMFFLKKKRSGIYIFYNQTLLERYTVIIFG